MTMTSDSIIFFIVSPKSFFAYIINFLLMMSKKFIIYAKKDLGLKIKNILESEVIVTTLENTEELLIVFAI